MKRENGYLTVCLAVCLPVILSLCVTLIEGARQNAARLEGTCVCETAFQSVMAEYHRELQKQYDIFAIDTSYGSRRSGRERVEARLHYYVKENLDRGGVAGFLFRDLVRLSTGLETVERVTILSDEDGAVFRSLAVASLWENCDLQMLEQLKGWVEAVEVNGLARGNEETSRQQVDAEISEYQNQYPELDIQNPIENQKEVQRKGILSLLVEEENFSGKSLAIEDAISMRLNEGRVSRGNQPFEVDSQWIPGMDRLLFQRYLSERMGYFGNVGERKALDYEQEYLVAGKSSDVENLRAVANRLLLLREAANMLYLWNCQTKRNEALAMAEVICGAVALPELIPVMEVALLLGWAYGESISDMRSLLKGGKVPLFKGDEDWKMSLSGALNHQTQTENGGEKGLSYEDYLAILMMLEPSEVLTLRAMNLIEANIRKTDGNEAFRLDACYVALTVNIRLHGAGGTQYEYQRYRKYE